MRRTIFAFIVLAAFTVAARAQIVLEVTFNQSSNVGITTWTIAVSDEDAIDIKDAIAAFGGWTATVKCTQEMVDAADCLSGELGTQVTNPETQNAAVKRSFRQMLGDVTRTHQQRIWQKALGTPVEVITVDN